MPRLLAIAALILAIPTAAAGSQEAPEIVDPVGDCSFAPANHYADIVAAWIAEETATDFQVHVQLAEWINDGAGMFTGLTVQFTHQGIEWGVVALRNVEAWEFSTGHVNTQTGEIEGYNETSGTFDTSAATFTILFPKSLFPHNGNDDKLTSIFAATADLKKDVPFFVALGSSPTALTICDRAEATAAYTFTVGEHTMHGAASANATTEAGDDVEGLSTNEVPASPSPVSAPSRGVPAPGLLAVLAVACLAALRRTK